jgi:hypothetical protein
MFLGRMQFSPSCPCPSSFCDWAKMALTGPFTPSHLTPPCGTPSTVVPSSPRELGSVRFGSGCCNRIRGSRMVIRMILACMDNLPHDRLYKPSICALVVIPWAPATRRVPPVPANVSHGKKGISSQSIFAMSLPALVMPAPNRGSIGEKPPATYQER